MDPKSESPTQDPTPKIEPADPQPADEPKHVAAAPQPQVRPRCRILSLPPEILMLILREVRGGACDSDTDPPNAPGLRAIQNTRLTCRHLGSLGTHVLLSPTRPLTVTPEARSLARLEGVSRHAVLRRGVRGVRVDLRHYAPRLAGDPAFFAQYCRAKLGHCVLHWRGVGPRTTTTMTATTPGADDGGVTPRERDRLCARADAMCDAWIDPPPPPPADSRGESSGAVTQAQREAHQALLRRAHAAYAALFRAQEAARGGFGGRVAAALGRLPHTTLQRLEFDDAVPADCDRLDIRALRDADSTLRILAAPASWADAVDAELRVGPPPEPVFAVLAALRGLPPDLAIRVPLAANTGYTPDKAARARVRAAAETAPGLRSFRYAPRAHALYFVPRGLDPQVEFLAALLGGAAAARRLEELVFEAPEDEGVLDFGAVLAEGAWPALREVSLSRVALRLEDLERFVQKGCGPGLRSVRLHRVKLLSGTWAQTAEVLRGLQTRPRAVGESG